MLRVFQSILLIILVPAMLLANDPQDSVDTAMHLDDQKSSKKKNAWRKLGQSTLIYAPDDFSIQEPEQMTFKLEGVRMDVYSRDFAQGDVVYLEILRPAGVHGFYSYLYDKDGNQLPLTRTAWGYRILLPIGAQDKREKIELLWKQSVADRFGKARIEIPINEKSFPQTRWYNRVGQFLPEIAPRMAGGEESDPSPEAAESPDPPGGSGTENRENLSAVQPAPGKEPSSESGSDTGPAHDSQSALDSADSEIQETAEEREKREQKEKQALEEEKSEEQLSNFMKKITLEKSLRSQVFERKGNDLITSRLSHPRDMHYVTSQCFTSRVKVSYRYENGRRVEVGRRVVMHNGVDLRGRPGTPIYSIADGQVVLARSMHFEGNFTIIDHGLGIFSGYMHQSNLRVQVGQYVRAGERIGDVGNPGYSTGPHLHLSLWIRGVPVDPISLYSLPIRD